MLWDAERHADETKCKNDKEGDMVAWKVEPAVAHRRYALYGLAFWRYSRAFSQWFFARFGKCGFMDVCRD
jgi:hypothetical protein